MPSCIRLVALWLFVLAFQLLQEPSTSTYMCRYKRHKEVISVEDAGYNCKTMKVKLGMCVGTCTSYAIPIPLEGDDNEPRFQTGCECCAPKDLKERTIRFGDGCEKSIVISQIRSCECKNCSRRDLWELRYDSTISRNLAYGWWRSSCKMVRVPCQRGSTIRLYHNNKHKLFDRGVDCRNYVISNIETLKRSREFSQLLFLLLKWIR